MKLSISNSSLNRKFGFENSLKMIKDAGFDAVDYDLMARWKPHQLEEDYLLEAQKMRAYMDEIGRHLISLYK